ncbi:hypothetical protein FXN63_00085 [Pigmentiphaga aceris]|uniref:Uncharacterized protein n=1 Tax=Pigmentiphaga aceris TaxID=1940612 RepID=A0A5C0AUR8_9BURK|nr:hypothetical protein [Pigmentiphaga aceris]QEI04411.1 hypothetical protein FXN63_00085 [Pigmentiphaga aceris]
MKHRLTIPILIKTTLGAAIILVIMFTNLLSNSWMLLTDRGNFIPAESSIFSFEPYVINPGSSNYWIYGEDGKHYYYFSYDRTTPYAFIAKSNSCPNFDRLNFKTWCSAQPGHAATVGQHSKQ